MIDNEVTLEVIYLMRGDGLTEFFQEPCAGGQRSADARRCDRGVAYSWRGRADSCSDRGDHVDPRASSSETAVSTPACRKGAERADRWRVLTVLDLLKTPTTTIWAMRGLAWSLSGIW